jgi:hypothetical protein
MKSLDAEIISVRKELDKYKELYSSALEKAITNILADTRRGDSHKDNPMKSIMQPNAITVNLRLAEQKYNALAIEHQQLKKAEKLASKENTDLKTKLSNSRYRGIEDLLARHQEPNPDLIGHDMDVPETKDLHPPMKFGKGEAEEIEEAPMVDFVCRNIISSDGYSSLPQFCVDFAKLIAKSAGSPFVEVRFFEQETLNLFCDVYRK